VVHDNKAGFFMIALTYIDSLNNKIKIGPRALSNMGSFIQNTKEKDEAGGVLLGRFLIGNSDIVVDRITVPMRGDGRSRFGYFRSKNVHQKQISEAWVSSRGTCNYLGEWHTHPEDDPRPSSHDLNKWKDKLALDQFDSDFLFFIIVGTKHVNVWKGYRNNIKFEQLTLLITY
jgi:integrative and conjugative element protein (TIGR02256 family)